MQARSRLILASLAATLLMAIAVSSASANRLSASNQGIRAVFTPLTFNAGSLGVECDVTLEGSFHSRTIVKTAHSLIGHVSRAILANCVGGGATILTETLPWHLTYESISGTLPDIVLIRLLLVGAAFRIGALGFNCLATTTAERPAFGNAEREAGGNITTLTADETASIPLRSAGGFGCPFEEGNFIGEGEVFLLGTTARIEVRLI